MTRAVLLLGFGGPTRVEDVRPFLAQVLRGRPVPPHRIDEVVRQYERIGGRSPFNELASALADGLKDRLARDGAALPVYVGMRNAAPFASDVVARMVADGVQEAVVVVLAAFRSRPSWNYYLRTLAEALAPHGRRGFRVRFLSPWNESSLYIDALADRASETLATVPADRRDGLRWVFTAHSIPVDWDAAAGYTRQIRATAARVAERLAVRDWTLVFQSRSGRPEDPWLAPDVGDHLAGLPRGAGAILVPVGFLMDHVEVLFDLDVKAREAAARAGVDVWRAPTVGTHPKFIELLSSRIRATFYSTAVPVSPVVFSSPMDDLLVVGAGITGLAAAHRWTERAREQGRDPRLTLVDAAPRAGGVIASTRRDGVLTEDGPDSFITDKPWGLDLARRLGLEAEIIGTNRKFTQSFIVRRGRLHPTPEGFYLLAPSRLTPLARSPLISWAGKLRMGMELFLPPRRDTGDESLGAFVRRRFGREALDQLAQPMVAGIYSADPETLSLQATFPRFLDMERRSGSVTRALLLARKARAAPRAPGAALPSTGVSGPRYGLFASFRGGLGTLTDALAARLPAGSLRLGVSVRALSPVAGGWRAVLSDGEVRSASAVCLALPAPAAARLVAGWDDGLAAVLASIPYASVATLNVVFPRSAVGHPLDGFGFVVPSREGLSLTGCTFGSVKYEGRAPADRVLLRAFVGGDVLNRPDDVLVRDVLADLRRLLDTRGEPLAASLVRYPESMPQYTLGHLDRVADIAHRLARRPGLVLAGNAYHGIGLPDCIHSGERAADALTPPARAALVPSGAS
jgi:oxygen-dependent protoporphyrinogen oxidase